MKNYKSLKWSFGIALTMGLTACNWNMQHSQQMDTRYDAKYKQHQEVQHNSKTGKKTYASSEPTQKSTPGPVRKAAPQLPVIQ